MYNIVVYKNIKNECYGEFDISTKEVLLNDFIVPYLSNKPFYVDGSEVNHNDVKQIIISKSDDKIQALIQKAKYVHHGEWYFATEENVASDKDFVEIITTSVLKEAKELINKKEMCASVDTDIIKNNKRVFVVFGHDENSELKISQFISKLDLQPIILNEKANGGKTIIEKLEENSDVGFAVVLYTPDDIVLNDNSEKYKQPRPNVIFEYGYFIGKLGRTRVALLVKDDIKEHSDIIGTGYIKIDEHEGWKLQVAKELKSAGYAIDLNKVI